MNEQRLKQIKRQYDELQQRLQEPGSWQDPALFARLQRELQELSPVAVAYTEWEKTEQELSELEEMLSDPEMKEIAWEEKQALLKRREQQAVALRLLLLPKDPNDGKNVIMEIRAGVGGEEGALFASDLYRMYSLYAETRRWKLDIVNVSETELGGIKEISFVVEGENAFSRLKYEGGGHRVQRVPVTESGGRIHTSSATVAVLPQVEEVDFRLDMNELYKNKDRALQIMRAKLYEREQERQHAELAAERKSQVGTGDRSDRIRTYNFPQNRVTDHRLSGEGRSFNLERIINGNLDPLLDALTAADQAEKLAEGESAE